jgi:hypothetical protein
MPRRKAPPDSRQDIKSLVDSKMMDDIAKLPAHNVPISRRDEHHESVDPAGRRSLSADQLVEHDDGQWLMHAVSTACVWVCVRVCACVM